jgi:hypothetical protein
MTNSQKFLANKTTQAFLKAERACDLATQVRLAREVVRKLIMVGGIDTTRLGPIDALVGRPFNALPVTDGSGLEWQDYSQHIAAAIAIGIAIGQLVHPDVFKKGGA